MPFKKGNKIGKGRPEGVPNKATTDVREAMAKAAEYGAENFIRWLERVAAGDPKKGLSPNPEGAANLYLKALEYHIPKLARTEMTGANGQPLFPLSVAVKDEKSKKLLDKL